MIQKGPPSYKRASEKVMADLNESSHSTEYITVIAGGFPYIM